MNRALLVAEIGVNHGGSRKKAEELIRLAARSGADAVKFQAYRAERLAAAKSPTYFQQTGDAAKTQRQFFERYDALGPEDYRLLADVAERAGVEFLCTPFDEDAVAFLHPLVSRYKIASADITHWPLLRAVASTGKPALLSTGASTWEEIDRAVRWLLEHGCPQVTLLHCVLSYPTQPEQANLGLLRKLAMRFPDCGLGYSDHTMTIEAAYVAYLLGASVIEKHFTDDRKQDGNDHYHSMDADSLAALRKHCDDAARLIGNGDRAEALPCEAQARIQARRGLYTAKAFPAGHILEPGDLVAKRPAAGLEPFWLPRVAGRALAHALPEEAPLLLADLS